MLSSWELLEDRNGVVSTMSSVDWFVDVDIAVAISGILEFLVNLKLGAIGMVWNQAEIFD